MADFDTVSVCAVQRNAEGGPGETRRLLRPRSETFRGLSVFMTAVFLVGEMAGSGVLAMPQAVESTSFGGLVLLCFCGFVCSYTGEVLSQCWTIVRERYPELRERQIRRPYPDMGMITFGRFGKYLVTFCIDFTMLGGAVVFLIMAGENLRSMFNQNHWYDLDLCYWMIIVFGIVWPFTMYGTPKDFKYIGVCAMAATTIACITLVVLMGLDSETAGHAHHGKLTPLSFGSAFGTMLYAFGGHPMFPTFQTDMKEPSKFGKSCRIAYMVLVLMYLPVAATGYFVYGDKIQDNILLTVHSGVGLQVVQGLITCHLICGFVIIINPVCQQLEDSLGISTSFNWKRVLSRTSVCGLVLFLAESCPHFGAILSLVGGSTMTAVAFVLPPMFLFKLANTRGNWPTVYISIGKKMCLIAIMMIGIVAGCVSTYTSVRDIAGGFSFVPPCFVNVTAANG